MSTLFAGVVIFSLSLVATGRASNSKGSGPTPDKQTTNPTAQKSPAEPSNITSAKGFVLEDTTPVRLRLNRTISSADSHVGDTVDFEVLQDISVNGTLVIPRGSLAFGTVTEAQPTRKMARGGKLEINIDYVKLLDSEKAALRAVQGGKGGSHVVVMAAGIVATGLIFMPAAPYFLFMHGKDMVIPKGAEVTGYINGDVNLDITKFQESQPTTAPASVVTGTGPGVNANSAKLQTEASPSGADIKIDGFFLDHTYTNDYFTLSYHLPREWVLETDLIRNRLASGEHSQGANLLLAAVHIPQDVTELRADASFRVLAVARSAHANTENCGQYLETLRTSLRASKSAKRKGEVSEYTVAGHEFSRANFEYRSGTSDRAVICSPARDYLLLWKVEGSYWESVDDAASTIYAIVPWPTLAEQPELSKTLTQVRVSRSTSASLLLKRVQPVYPAEARENHIQGTVRMQAVISKTGDVVNLDLLEGPIELAMSAVTAVRQWKYRPYLLNGEPVAVCTEVVVNYSSGPM